MFHGLFVMATWSYWKAAMTKGTPVPERFKLNANE
jgi:hypothetical protein